MEKQFEFAYGSTSIPLTIRAGRMDVIESVTPAPIEDLKEAFRRAVEEDAIASAPLRDVVHAQDEVTVVISDVTRAYMHQERICPLLLDYLHDVCGIPDEHIVFLVAVGTHRAQTAEELRRIASPEVTARVRVVNHDCDGETVAVGVTSRGTQVRVNPLVVGRKVILLGGTVHHFFAGYGGGRKSILPGVSARETIMQNHAHALDPMAAQPNPLCGLGVTGENPVHEDMAEAAALVGPVFGINMIVDGQGRHLALPSGHWMAAWQESCKQVDGFNGVEIPARADAVVVCAGGYPKDINLYQSCKSLINGFQAVKPGGKLIFISQCSEGGGPAEFFGWSRYLPDNTLDAALRANFTVAGYIFYECVAIADSAQVHVLSDLDPADLTAMHMLPHADPAELLALLDFGDDHVIVMPRGANTVPMVKE
ncbi:MAG: nickel-dependent lactate racemase [Clostridiales bacterium]|nr:nickel-dependent lactate racemase [Clostridiales bacterium]